MLNGLIEKLRWTGFQPLNTDQLNIKVPKTKLIDKNGISLAEFNFSAHAPSIILPQLPLKNPYENL